MMSHVPPHAQNAASLSFGNWVVSLHSIIIKSQLYNLDVVARNLPITSRSHVGIPSESEDAPVLKIGRDDFD